MTKPSQPDTDSSTPIPWEVEGTLIWAPDAKANIAQVSELRTDDYVGFTPPSISSPDFHEIAANAAFIVRAVNNHAKLLAALEAVADSFGRKLDATLTADEVEALTQVAAVIEEAKK
ncbi:hypothetical protein LCGC14_2002520 [marine sediment metagenome]|uniref:Uncharacterized protein n=1 Tax=marine sediment metagenome TaxID=412755 RepID=A0A0F9HZT9_9ZZZZ